ncbi:ThiF family adenylyltransferase [Streptacidiphilus sp. 4-A2]|nr:ThiF family adenylyltransferase [Streptacidiphilus sp. 4-A2]
MLGAQAGTPQLMRIAPTGASAPARSAPRRRMWSRRREDGDAAADDHRHNPSRERDHDDRADRADHNSDHDRSRDRADDQRYDRQIPLLGREFQRQLAGTTVAVVGLGGLGSFAALECAHLGFGRLVLVDPDTVEHSNLNRLLGATEADVGRPKVEVYADLLRAVAPTSTVEAVHDSVLSEAALGPVRAADLLLGCVDSHGARLVLNQLAVQYVIPYLDAGSGTRIDDAHRVTHVGGQIQAVLPGMGCLECRGFIDARQAAFDLAPSHIRDREIAHGYGTREPAPSVVFLNGVVGSLLVAQAVQLLSGALRTAHSGPVPAITLYNARPLPHRRRGRTRRRLPHLRNRRRHRSGRSLPAAQRDPVGPAAGRPPRRGR